MFTGIVERVSSIEEISVSPGGKRLKVSLEAISSSSGDLAPWSDLTLGESISVDGVCLTLVEMAQNLVFDVVEETLRRSSLGDRQVGDGVNLERSLRLGDRMGGHYVTGHIDTTGTIQSMVNENETIWVIRHPHVKSFRTVEKGSVTVDGVSLTVVESHADWFSVALIPHTLEVTSFGIKKVDHRVNLEMDHFGRWVDSLLKTEEETSS